MPALPSVSTFLLLLLPLVAAVEKCHPGCRCVVESFGLFSSFSLTKVNCRGMRPFAGPIRIPLDTAFLDLSFSSLGVVKGSMLAGPGYTTLVGLNLSHNHISEVDHGAFDRLRYLESLDLSYNTLKELKDDWLARLSLTDLDLSHNYIHKLRLEAFSTATHSRPINVNASDNLLTTVTWDPQSAPSNLHSLILARNQLTSVPNLQGIPLRYLSLDGNPIHVIEQNSFAGLSDLVHLSLRSLLGLSVIQNYSFRDLRSLQVLDLSQNANLTFLDPRMLFGLVSLQELDVSGSGVTSLPSDILNHLPSIQTVKLKDDIWCRRTRRQGHFHWHMGEVSNRELLTCNTAGVLF